MLDHIDTYGRFTVYWDRGITRFVVYNSTDEMVYAERAAIYSCTEDAPLTAHEWAQRMDAAYTATYQGR